MRYNHGRACRLTTLTGSAALRTVCAGNNLQQLYSLSPDRLGFRVSAGKLTRRTVGAVCVSRIEIRQQPMSDAPGAKSRGYSKMPNAVIDTHLARIGPYCFAIYACMERFSTADRRCWPSLARLEDLTGISRPTLVKYLKNMHEARMFTTEGGSGKRVIYTLLPPSDWLTSLTSQSGELVKEVNRTSKAALPELVNDVSSTGKRALPPSEKDLKKKTQGRRPITKTPRAAGAGPCTAPTWAAYREAFVARYLGAEPARNATTNAQMAAFVRRLGAETAPLVARFYVEHNNRYYVQKRHSVGAMLHDAESLLTDFQTGHRTTETAARQDDRLEAQSQVWQGLLMQAECDRNAR